MIPDRPAAISRPLRSLSGWIAMSSCESQLLNTNYFVGWAEPAGADPRSDGHKREILAPRSGEGSRGRKAHNNFFSSAVIRDVVLRWNAPTDHKQNEYNYPHFHSELLVLALASVTLNWGRKAD